MPAYVLVASILGADMQFLTPKVHKFVPTETWLKFAPNLR